jgi:branched-chain amino acid transport system permease protein
VSDFLQYSFNGLTTGVVYALIGVGLTIGIGVARFFNFAQGQFVILAAFIAAVLTEQGVPFFVTLPIALGIVAVLGIAIHTSIVRFAGDDGLVIFLGTLGFGIVLTYCMVLIWGAEQREIAAPFSGNVVVGDIVLPEPKLMLLAISAPVIAALYVLLARTDVGRSLRACAENPEVSMLLGVNVQRTMRGALALGSALAALAGVLIGTLFPFSAFAGGAYLIKGIAVALAGGLGSVSGALVCGLGLGLIETFATAYGVPVGFYTFGGEWQDGYAFLLMIAVLAARPRGLFRGTGEL